MTVRIDVWSDFVCPFCYKVSLSLESLEASHDVAVHWRSFELRPAGSPPMPPEYLARIEATTPRLVQQFWEEHAIEIKRGPFGINSHKALIGAKYAESQGAGAEYHDAAFRAYWQAARDISDVAVLRDIAVSVELDAEAFEAALNDPKYDEQVIADIMQAYQYNLSGAPALIFDNRYLVSGAYPLETLQEVVEKVEFERS